MRSFLMMLCLATILTASPVVAQTAERDAPLLELYSAEDMYSLGEEFRMGGRRYPKDLKKALEWHLMAAERGHARSMFTIGNMYLYGNGVDKNRDEAIVWFKKSVEAGGNGSAPAAEALAGLYESGNCEQSVLMWRKAAELGLQTAQSRLGLIYFNGQCAQRDLKEAARWLQASAETGDVMSAIFLASLYHKGDGVQQSNLEARYWAEIATRWGHPGFVFADEFLNPVLETSLTEAEKILLEERLAKLPPMLRPLNLREKELKHKGSAN
jgi:TPR repeat protein